MAEFDLTSWGGATVGALIGGAASSIGAAFSSTTGCFFLNEKGKAAASLVEWASASKMKDIVQRFRITFAYYFVIYRPM